MTNFVSEGTIKTVWIWYKEKSYVDLKAILSVQLTLPPGFPNLSFCQYSHVCCLSCVFWREQEQG